MNKKRVLITGGTGYIGRQTLRPLLDLNYEIHLVGRRLKICDWLPPDVQCHEHDLLSPGSARELLQMIKPSHLLHLAWDVTHGVFWHSDANLNWVAASLELIKEFGSCDGKAMVLAGTCAEYRWTESLLSEDTTPLEPKQLYGVCKNSLNAIAESFCRQKGIKYSWGRIFFSYGPFEGEQRLVPFLIREISKHQSTLRVNPHHLRDFLHVEDVGRAFVSLLDSDGLGAVNIGSGKGTRIGEIVDLLAEIIGYHPENIEQALNRGSEPEALIADNSKLLAAGWSPRKSLESGLKDAVRYWHSQEGH